MEKRSFHKRRYKYCASNSDLEVHNDQVQLDWIRGLIEQIDFANDPQALPDYTVSLNVAPKRTATGEGKNYFSRKVVECFENNHYPLDRSLKIKRRREGA